jgi:hypothetical protein
MNAVYRLSLALFIHAERLAQEIAAVSAGPSIVLGHEIAEQKLNRASFALASNTIG